MLAAVRILVFGPGMIGTLLAARLSAAGNDVTVLARGPRLSAIRERGLRIRSRAGEVIEARVDAVEALDGPGWDWILATLRGDQVSAALPALAAHRETRNVMILANHAGDLAPWAEAVGAERLALGFPGASGAFDADGVLVYQLAPRALQPTTLGQLAGHAARRLVELADTLESAGIPTAIEARMDAWLRCHVAWISTFALMSAASGYDGRIVVEDRALRRRTAAAAQEALAVVRALGVPLTPAGLRLLAHSPVSLVAFALGRVARDPAMRLVLEDPTPGRRAEARHMAGQMLELADRAGAPVPAYRALVDLAGVR